MIKIVNVKKKYLSKSVLDGVNISISKGEIYGLIGKNGAGKTTLMKIVVGLQKETSGTVLIEKEDGKPAVIGYLPDSPMIYEYLYAGEYIVYLLMKKDKTRVDELLELADLNYKEKIKDMSKGMKQRLGIVASLANNPDILILDEPTSALDPGGRLEVLNLLKKLREMGKTIIISTHILNDMQNICDRVGFLSDGVIKKELNINSYIDNEAIRVRFNGNIINELKTLDNSINVDIIANGEYIFRSNAQDFQKKIFFFLSNTNMKVLSIRNESINLDDIFSEVCR
jgi:ABC-type multidrug transport system, ATPase component